MLPCEGWRRGEEREREEKRKERRREGYLKELWCSSDSCQQILLVKFQNSKIPKFQNSKIPKVYLCYK